MRDAIQKILNEIAAALDGRIHLFDVQIHSLEEGALVLSGRVLERTEIQPLTDSLSREFPALRVDTDSIRVLQGPNIPSVHVTTNLTGLYEKPSFGVPLASELYYGTNLQVLEEKDRWVLVRQKDGYLGWAYRPYLAEGHAPEATHLVMAPSVELWDQPELQGTIVTRLVSGTGVVVEKMESGWACVTANKTGWLPAGLLRPVKEFPQTLEERRARIVGDSTGMIGTPYLWGGMSGNGIDCSGLARLAHRWIGLEIPRDADMQQAAAKPVEPPLEAGDLLFFGEGDGDRHVTHVGISLGEWTLIHSSRSRNGVYVDDMEKADYLREIYMCAGTFIR
jgi:hypothetical protein